MVKFIEDDWTGEAIDLSEPFYLVNTDIVSIDNLKQKEIIVYYDDEGNEYSEEDVTEFNNIEELLIFVKDRIECYENIIEDLKNRNLIISEICYNTDKEKYEKILTRLNYKEDNND